MCPRSKIARDSAKFFDVVARLCLSKFWETFVEFQYQAKVSAQIESRLRTLLRNLENVTVPGKIDPFEINFCDCFKNFCEFS